jgi:hypothetical protein
MTVYTSTQLTTDSGDRHGVKPSLVVLHHTAFAGSIQNLVNSMMPGGRTVSAHAAIKDGQIINVVPESRRSFSLGAAIFERRVLSAECVNSTASPSWSLSDATHESIAQWVADVCRRHGIRPHREGAAAAWTVISHREVSTIHREGYATACPGGMRVDWIVARAQQLLTPTTTPTATKEDDMAQGLLFRNSDTGEVVFGNLATGMWVGLGRGYPELLKSAGLIDNADGTQAPNVNRPGNEFGYFRSIAMTARAGQVDTVALSTAVTDAVRLAVAAQGVSVDLAPVLAAVTAAAASINANVDEIPLGFTITAK